MTIAVMVAVALQASAPAVPAELNRLEGEWVCRVARSPAAPRWRRETWRIDSAGQLNGEIRVEQGTAAGQPMVVEDADVFIGGRSLIYQQFDGLMPYRLARSDRNGTVYEHAGSGNLRWIRFGHDQGRFLTVTHVYRDGRRDSWTYQRSGTRSAPPYCSGSYRR